MPERKINRTVRAGGVAYKAKSSPKLMAELNSKLTPERAAHLASRGVLEGFEGNTSAAPETAPGDAGTGEAGNTPWGGGAQQ